LEEIRREQDFQLSGEVDDATALDIGRLLGAQTIVSGRVSSFGGYFRLTIHALEVQTARVQGQYNRNLGTERAISALMGTGGGQVAQAPAPQPARAVAAQAPAVQAPVQAAAPPAPAITAIEVTARSAGTLFFQDREIATLWDNETYTIPIDGPGTFALRMATAEFTDTRSIVVNTRGITRVSLGGVFAVGQTGPAGGIIFYDRGRHIDGWRWLEAASRDLAVPAEWGASNEEIIGTSTALGTGRQNTQIIVNHLRQRNESGRAAELAQNFIQNGFTDWFLPSREELNLMHINLRQRGLGNFTGNEYWSSSQGGSIAWGSGRYRRRAWTQNFGDGIQNSPLKNTAQLVRPIRAF